MEQEPIQPGSESLLSLSSHFLSLRDFANCRRYALLARTSYPNLAVPDQILTVANVLLAAERRLPNNHMDWYSILQIPRPATRAVIKTQFIKLLFLSNPSKNQCPFAEEAYKLVCDAWSELSDPDKKTQYDIEINNACNEANNENVNGYVPRKAEKPHESNDNGTFWTVCPYCYYMYQFEKVYEEHTLRCQNCRRAFHGVAVMAPSTHSVVVEGKEEKYYCGSGRFPLGFNRLGGDGNLGGKKAKCGDKSGGFDDVLEISDESYEQGGLNVKVAGVNVERSEANVRVGEAEGVMQGNEKAEVRDDGKRGLRNVKSVARKTKKIMGKGVKIRRAESMAGAKVELNMKFGSGADGNGIRAGSGNKYDSGNENGGGYFEDKVGFFDEDDDVYLRLKDSF
ncbi:DnaJ domain-containing protein [Cephalotus follicularis]|uniref:DnaJ domain-containing protein n=1 Tax=Cephalotus follicularis TaxID=3775 RepID=A0A1Q3ATZ1_CEPFO|nr:DnaJ domain-containing protein [Cephalotus follicularis]